MLEQANAQLGKIKMSNEEEIFNPRELAGKMFIAALKEDENHFHMMFAAASLVGFLINFHSTNKKADIKLAMTGLRTYANMKSELLGLDLVNMPTATNTVM